jgi:hypothetical protein
LRDDRAIALRLLSGDHRRRVEAVVIEPEARRDRVMVASCCPLGSIVT